MGEREKQREQPPQGPELPGLASLGTDIRGSVNAYLRRSKSPLKEAAASIGELTGAYMAPAEIYEGPSEFSDGLRGSGGGVSVSYYKTLPESGIVDIPPDADADTARILGNANKGAAIAKGISERLSQGTDVMADVSGAWEHGPFKEAMAISQTGFAAKDDEAKLIVSHQRRAGAGSETFIDFVFDGSDGLSTLAQRLGKRQDDPLAQDMAKTIGASLERDPDERKFSLAIAKELGAPTVEKLFKMSFTK